MVRKGGLRPLLYFDGGRGQATLPNHEIIALEQSVEIIDSRSKVNEAY